MLTLPRKAAARDRHGAVALAPVFIDLDADRSARGIGGLILA